MQDTGKFGQKEKAEKYLQKAFNGFDGQPQFAL